MYRKYKTTVVIPAYNEEESIGKVLNDIPKTYVDEIIVVDNASTDGTAREAQKYDVRVVTEYKKGYGAACKKGIIEAKDPDIIVILDGDYSDYPEQLPCLIEPIIAGEADFVLGSRVLGKREKGALVPQAYWGNKLATGMIKLFFCYTFTDMGPFRAIRSETLKKLNMTDDTFGWNAEMQIKALKHNVRIKEVPVDYRKRIGKSKISGTVTGTVKAGWKIIFTILKYKYANNVRDAVC